MEVRLPSYRSEHDKEPPSPVCKLISFNADFQVRPLWKWLASESWCTRALPIDWRRKFMDNLLVHHYDCDLYSCSGRYEFKSYMQSMDTFFKPVRWIVCVYIIYWTVVPYVAMLRHRILPIARQKRFDALWDSTVNKVRIDKQASGLSFPEIASDHAKYLRLEDNMNAWEKTAVGHWRERVSLLQTLLDHP